MKVKDCSLSQSVETACGKQAQKQIANVHEQVNDTIEVTIHVTDIDDSPPVFRNRYLATGMRRNTEPDTELQLMLRVSLICIQTYLLFIYYMCCLDIKEVESFSRSYPMFIYSIAPVAKVGK